MRILLSGASGFVGGYLCGYLRAQGHEPVRLVRNSPAAPGELAWDPAGGQLDPSAFDGVDVVINLSGASIAGQRWDAAYKRLILDSRVDATRLLAETMAGRAAVPAARDTGGTPALPVFISMSAVGWYGHRGPDEDLDERSEPGSGFVAEVCHRWEAAADPARAAGIRVAHPRLGIVIGPGGALEKLLPPFRAGVGGQLGSGAQAFSWVALDDVGPALLHIAGCSELDGGVNLTAPNPVSNAELAHLLGAALHRPSLATVPAFALRMLLGEAADELLSGQRVLPRKLLDSGFAFGCGNLRDALARYLPQLAH